MQKALQKKSIYKMDKESVRAQPRQSCDQGLKRQTSRSKSSSLDNHSNRDKPNKSSSLDNHSNRDKPNKHNSLDSHNNRDKPNKSSKQRLPLTSGKSLPLARQQAIPPSVEPKPLEQALLIANTPALGQMFPTTNTPALAKAAGLWL